MIMNKLELIKLVYPKLDPFQRNVIKECLMKETGGCLNLPVGSGKTITSIVLSLIQSIDSKDPCLFIVSKSLVSSWLIEIAKFFTLDNQIVLNYEVVANVYTKKLNEWKLNPNTVMVITTPQTLAKYYRLHQISDKFVVQIFEFHNEQQQLGAYVNHYAVPNTPYLNMSLGGATFHSLVWPSIVIDEIQEYTNVKTDVCLSISSLCSKIRWGMSGTPISEPNLEKIMGLILILNLNDIPRNLPELKTFLKYTFKGFNQYTIFRERNEMLDHQETPQSELVENIISCPMKPDEKQLYTMFKKILQKVKAKVRQAKLDNNVEMSKKYSSYILVMILYLRQICICPFIPISSIFLESLAFEHKTELIQFVKDELNTYSLIDYLSNSNNVKSSRIEQILNTLKEIKGKTLIFSCFDTTLKLLSYYTSLDFPNRKVFKLDSQTSISKRGNILKEFNTSKADSILLLTYKIGSTGLNLQCANSVIISDFWWNSDTTKQAVGRVSRFGQLSPTVHVYFFTSNTGIENIIFKKQKAKTKIIEELKTGTMKSKIPKVSINEVIRFLETENENEILVKENYKFTY